MDAYEATRVVFSRIQSLDPENAAKIMGLLLIQDHGEKEMIRLAFGPEALLHSVIMKARKELIIQPLSPGGGGGAASPFLLRQSSASRMAPLGLTVSSPSWAPPQQFQNSAEELISPTANPPSPFYGGGGGGGDLIDEFQLQDQLSFLNDAAAAGYPEECRSPYQQLDWGVNGHHRRSCSVTDLCLSDPAGFGWRPCLYFARGYCKNGSSCRFLHGLPDDPAVKLDDQSHELLLRSKSLRLGGSASQLMASAAAFPYSPTGSLPQSPSTKCMNFLLQQQQNDSQRAAAAALMLGEQEAHKFLTRSRSDFAGMVNPSSRQIYLTFPADSTFREEDVSNYFSIYGPVQDVRIPYQQKRMFGFVTFVYPETVKLILAKGNPHFVCDSRVLVKPYKEKGKVPDKYRKQPSGDFSGCSTPPGLDPRDPYDLQLGSRMLYGSQDVLLRRKLEEQQQAAELQQAIELQARRFMGLQLLDLKNRSLASAHTLATMAGATPAINVDIRSGSTSSQSGSPPDEMGRIPATAREHEPLRQPSVNAADKEESAAESSPNVDSDFQESNMEHNLPDSPFASPTKASMLTELSLSVSETETVPAEPAAHAVNVNGGNASHLMASPLDMAPFKSCFFQMPRFSSGHGAVGM